MVDSSTDRKIANATPDRDVAFTLSRTSRRLWLGVVYFLFLIFSGCIVDQIAGLWVPSCLVLAYSAFVVLIGAVIAERLLWHKVRIRTARLQDPSEISAWMLAGRNVERVVDGTNGSEEQFGISFISEKSKSKIPTGRVNLIIIARIKDMLHFRIFDSKGNRVVDKSESEVVQDDSELEELKTILEPVWDSERLEADQRERIIDQVVSVTDQSLAGERPKRFREKKSRLNREIERLNDLGKYGWTEYEVLSLKQQLVDFSPVDDLRAESMLALDELRDYAYSAKHQYDRETFSRWESRIKVARNDIEKGNESEDRGRAQERRQYDDSERLRAELRKLYEHIADYQFYWTHGSSIYRHLTQASVIIIPLLLLMGMFPCAYIDGPDPLSRFNWGALGAAGALSAAVLTMRKSDIVEIGNTEGENEVRKALLGGVLGLAAGVLSYGIIIGGLISGAAVPELGTMSRNADISQILANNSLSVVWAFAAGFSFERIFDRIRGLTESA